MISQEDRNLIRQEILEERHEELQEECRLHSDEEYALEQLADDKLMFMHHELAELANRINEHGWYISISDLIDRMREM